MAMPSERQLDVADEELLHVGGGHLSVEDGTPEGGEHFHVTDLGDMQIRFRAGAVGSH